MTHTSTHQSEALIFANDRPTSLDDDLYQWSIDAEGLIRRQHARIAELEEKLVVAQTVPSSVIAGAIFDFAGYLTTLPHKEAIHCSGVHDAAPMVKAITDWCKRRNLCTADARVETWREDIATQQGWKLVPVGWQFYEDGKWWNGDDRIKDHRKNTEEATHPIRDVYAVEQQSAQPDAAKPNSAKFDGVKKAAASVSIYVEVRECSHCGHVGINDADGSKAACNTCEWYGDSPREDKCPGCNRVGTMSAACPKCGSRTLLLAETHLLAAAAHGMEQDAARYQALVESGNFVPSPLD